MRRFLAALSGVVLGLFAGGQTSAQDLGTLKLGVQQFGTVSWELDVIKHHGLDRKRGFTLEVHDYLLNPLVGGSSITVQANVGTIIGGSINVPDGQSFNQLVTGLTRFNFILLDADPGEGEADEPVSITVTVSSPNGGGSFIVAAGTILAP